MHKCRKFTPSISSPVPVSDVEKQDSAIIKIQKSSLVFEKISIISWGLATFQPFKIFFSHQKSIIFLNF
ncbi:hypothetical protein B7C51_10480 [Paenibacillus larvae subsp. pulvifaciens]|uniref:Uncharacterized protein n=1 Tax=Paenibacillus larvae subsp. pulvifaciens TaxID=1477 RepID=A0A1V0UT38_9BACL|nr:hypothetical protein B7C51_10480 [Paenibacillus larvae subsp. pulvifaciens]